MIRLRRAPTPDEFRRIRIQRVRQKLEETRAYPETTEITIQQGFIAVGNLSEHATEPLKLDISSCGDALENFKQRLSDKVIGQPEAIDALALAYQTFLAGMNPPNRPISILLFAGATGVGKSHSVHSAADVLFGNKLSVTRIDCAEFQHSHEISKLTGAPAGYLGHRETEPLLSQSRIDKYQTAAAPLNLILFDEIEKAHNALWQLLLGIMDHGILTLGSGGCTDFSKSIIVMTTNLGAREMDKILKGGCIGFTHPDTGTAATIADGAIRGAFTPEFINRLDSIVTFTELSQEQLHRIFKIEMAVIQERVLSAKSPLFILTYTGAAAEWLLAKGTDKRYGARELKRTLEKHVVRPLSNIILSRQTDTGDTITVDVENGEIILLNSPR